MPAFAYEVEIGRAQRGQEGVGIFLPLGPFWKGELQLVGDQGAGGDEPFEDAWELGAGQQGTLPGAHVHHHLGRLGPVDAEEDVCAGLVRAQQTVRRGEPEREQLPQSFFVHGHRSVYQK